MVCAPDAPRMLNCAPDAIAMVAAITAADPFAAPTLLLLKDVPCTPIHIDSQLQAACTCVSFLSPGRA